jgi:hypothetical protein
MTHSPYFRAFATFLVAGALAACSSFPELTFPSDGGRGGAEDTVDPIDSGDGAPSADGDDAGGGEGSDATSPALDGAQPPPPDAAIDVLVPVCIAPPNGICCPNNVPCVGKKCIDRCDSCGRCAGSICCVPPNGKTESCVASAAACVTN